MKANGFTDERFFCTLFLALSLYSHHLRAQGTDSLDLKIGQMIMIGMPKAELDTAVLHEIESGNVGSIIYFEKNVPRTNSYAGLKKICWTYQNAAPIPMFIGIDQEGGKVNRLKEKYGFPRSITAAAMGKSRSLDSVRFYAGSTAATLAGLGININFAPVVDVAVNPDNPVIVKHERSFSPNEDTVIMMAKAYIQEHHRLGIITVLKHFPGHGSSKDDTHFGIADVTTTWTAKELKPYQSLIDSGYADAVMSAHIVNKNLDPEGYPGTLSHRILDSLLRNTIGFHGVIFSDDMQMHAIAKQYGLEESIRLGINAGLDIMCFSNNIQGTDERTVAKVHGIIRQLVADGKVTPQRIDQSYRRIMKLKSTIGVSELERYRKQTVQMRQEMQALRSMPKSSSGTESSQVKPSRKKKRNK
jgi:beta-N-acetylhexosaminidase